MHEWEVFMSTMVTRFSVIVSADTKAKATYKAFKEWRGKELNHNTPFSAFIKYFYEKIVLVS